MGRTGINDLIGQEEGDAFQPGAEKVQALVFQKLLSWGITLTYLSCLQSV